MAIAGAYLDTHSLTTSGAAYVYEASGCSWTQASRLTPSDFAADDQFGYAVSVSGDSALVGARWGDDMGDKSGSAYLFEYNCGTWTQKAKLSPEDGAADDVFGNAVAISGTKAIIGAERNDDLVTNTGSIYIYPYLDQPGLTPTDTDMDGTPDCNDNCPADPDKTEPGLCGCGVQLRAWDFEGGTTAGWALWGGPGGPSFANVEDVERGSLVMEFTGAITNG